MLSTILIIVADVVVLLLSAIQLAMLIRAILSWFPMDSNKFVDFLYGITEPFIIPIRLLFQKMNWFQNIPIDMSFMFTYLLLGIVQFALMFAI